MPLILTALGITITGNTNNGGSAMRVTTKGQVTIPLNIREKLGITPSTEVDFIEDGDRVILVKRKDQSGAVQKFRSLRGIAHVKMTTDEIMKLTRAD